MSSAPRAVRSVAAPCVAAAVVAAPSVTSNVASAESAFAPLALAIERLRDGVGIELPAVIAKGVSREFFEDFLDAHEDRMGVRLEYCNSCVVVYECPVSLIHERVHSAVYSVIRTALGVRAYSFGGGGPSCRIGDSSRQPDASLTPFSKPMPGVGAADAADDKGSPFPNVIVEVAVSQTLAAVLSKAAAWVGPDTTVQQAIVVKVGDARDGRARELHAYSYVRGAANPVQTIDFSIPLHAAVAPGYPAMQLHVPLAGLFFQAAGGVPAGLADPLDVDFFFVQQAAASATP